MQNGAGGGRGGSSGDTGAVLEMLPDLEPAYSPQSVCAPFLLPLPPAGATHALQPPRSWDLSVFKPPRCVVRVLPRGGRGLGAGWRFRES